MALNDIFTMIKADKYTQDGREELIKAQQAETEDKTYKPGEISERTGKQKQPDGSWKFPKQAGGKNAKKKDASKPKTGLEPGVLEELKKEVDSPEARKNHETFMEEYKNREFQELFGDAIKFDEYGLPSKETIQLKNNFLKKEGVSDPNKLTNSKFNALAQKLDKRFGINNIELSQELLVAKEDDVPETRNASKPASTKPTTAESKESTTEQKTPKPSVQEYMKAKSDIKKMEEAYKKQKEDYDYTQRVKANGMDTSLMFPMNVKPKELSENEEYLKAKDIVSRMEAKDSAPRVLTGDCKIRIRK